MKLLSKIKLLIKGKEPELLDGYKLPPKDISEPVLTIAALMETQPERWQFQCDGKSYPKIVDIETGEAFPYEREYYPIYKVYRCVCKCDWMTRDEAVRIGYHIDVIIKVGEDARELELKRKAEQERERLKGLYL